MVYLWLFCEQQRMEVEPSIVPTAALSYSERARHLSEERLIGHYTRHQPFPTRWSLPNPDQFVPLREGPTEQNQDGGILPHSNLDIDPRAYPLGILDQDFARTLANDRPRDWRIEIPYITSQLYWSLKRQDFNWTTSSIKTWVEIHDARFEVSTSTQEHHQEVREVEEAVVRHWKAAYGYSVWSIDDFQLSCHNQGIAVFKHFPVGLYYHWWKSATVQVVYTRAILIVNRCCPVDPDTSDLPKITSPDFVAIIQQVVVQLKLTLGKTENLGQFFEVIKVGPNEQSNWVSAYICQIWTRLFLRFNHVEIPSIDAFREGILIAIVSEQALALAVTRDLGLPQDNDYNPTVQNVPLPEVHLREDQLWSGNISVGERFPQLPQTHLDYYDSPANVRVFDNIPLIDILDGPTYHKTYTELILPLLDTDRCDETIATDTVYSNAYSNNESKDE